MPSPRWLIAVLGLAFLAYGCVLAWKATSADLVLGVGAALLLVAFIVPADWQKLSIGLPGGTSLEVERAAAAQEALQHLPHEAQQEIVPADEVPRLEAAVEETVSGAEPAAEQPAPAPTHRPPAELLARDLMNRMAFASNQTGTRWVDLKLKRRVDLPTSTMPVMCAVRRPGGRWAVGVPTLIGQGDPPRIAAGAGTWLDYQAIFPDFFLEAGAELEAEFPHGDYSVAWGTPSATSGKLEVLANDRFTWPPHL